jgi:1-acyl-sn-glycerol-3-phosphate acyltransferase
VRLLGGTTAVAAFRDFQDGGSRLMIAFRHPYGDEPQLLASVITRTIPAQARALGLPLRGFTHAHFVHGHEVALWSGSFVRWLLPRSGAVPIHHVKFDSMGMERLQRLMLDGAYPLALAPEGQVSYTSERVPRLERGFATIAFRCAEDLEAAGRDERVAVLPLSVHYRYGSGAPRVLERVLGMVERECGLEPTKGASPVQRLRAAAEAVVALAERFYAELDRTPTPVASTSLNDRWAAVIESALRSGERALRLSSEGGLMPRLYRIRQAGWDRIYREDLRPKTLSPLARALIDREAGEAWYAMRHMELADLGSYIDFDLPKEDDPIDLLIETASNYWDLTSRLSGGNITDRLNFAKKDAVIVVGEPLEMRARLGRYREGRKAALEEATRDLEKNYLDCIDRYRKEYGHGK